MNTIAFMPMLLTAVAREAQAAYPNEMCGILIGRDNQGPDGQWRLVERIEQVPNTFAKEEQHHRFLIDPRKLLEADKAAAAHGQTIIGFYHSHPDHPARPSSYDTERAWPVYTYLIVEVQNGKAGDITAWHLDEVRKGFVEQAMVDTTPVESNLD
jgi:proteasome lid subunit RPN8/RPN11